jgi:hypothetical protein
MLAGCVGAVLVVLALPRTLAYGVSAPGDEIVAALTKWPPPSPVSLLDAAEMRRAALIRHDDGHLHAELAALELALAHQAGFASRGGASRLERVEAEARAALALAPGQPYAWVALVHAMIARGADRSAVAPAYRRAVEIAPYEPALVVPRVELGFAALARNALDDDGQALLRDQIRRAAAGAPMELAQMARRRYALAAIRTVLADDPALRARFDAAYLSVVR